MDMAPIGSEHLYYYFNARPNRYHSPEKYEEFVEKYSRNPFTNMMVLTGFTSALVLLIVLSCAYLMLRKSCQGCCEGRSVNIASTLPANSVSLSTPVDDGKTKVWTNPDWPTPMPESSEES